MSDYKGIILAGGSGTRLHPLTLGVSKQLLPIFDKPMVYYPLSVLMLAGIKEILLISTPDDIESYKSLLKDGSQFGISIEYKIQPEPGGLAQAFILGEEFIGKSKVSLVLGDNIFYGQHFSNNLKNASSINSGATLFGYYVSDPERFGVVEFNKNNKVISLEEKPKKPKSNYAITGLYIFDNDVVQIAKQLNVSKRGETEIVDVIQHYKKKGKLKVELLGRGIAWLDTGTHQSLLQASNFVETLENRQGLKIACIEEIAYQNGLISKKQLKILANKLINNEYGKYLLNLCK